MVTVTILDIDSTLITIGCIDELGHLGNKAEIASITAQAMRGEFDHPAGRREGISFYEGSRRVKPAAVVVCFYGGRVIFVPASGVCVGWPDSIVSASAIRSSPPSIRVGKLAEHPMLHAPQAGKTNRIRTKHPLYQDGRVYGAAQEILGRFDQPSTLQAPLVRSRRR